MKSFGKFWERVVAYEGRPDPHGNLFVSPLGQWNADTLDVLHHGIDTVKQLYAGIIRADVLLMVSNLYALGVGQFLDFAGNRWLLKSGGQGGYRYILQNSDYGVLVHLQSRFIQPDLSGSHLKIELSPHFIYERSIDEIQEVLNNLASLFLLQVEPAGVAVHLALDCHGLEVPEDFDRILTTKARARRFSGAENVEFIGLSQIAQVYNRAETYMFGSASGLQFALYRKDIQAREADKLHFWRPIWEKATNPEVFPETVYSESKPVWRLEFRFHHTVIQEFAEGTGFDASSLKTVAPHFTGLWQYALNNFRLDQSATYIRPEWQYFMQDIVFNHKSPHLLYKRAKKKPGELNGRALAIAFGGLTSVYARNGFSLEYCFKALQQSGIFEDLCAHYGRKELGFDYTLSEARAVVHERLRKLLYTKILRGAAA